jgi:hypothetical protein
MEKEEKNENENISVKKMKDHLSYAILSTLNNEKKVSNEDTESMRKTYLTIFEDQEKYHSNNKNWWKEQFVYIAVIIFYKFRKV